MHSIEIVARPEQVEANEALTSGKYIVVFPNLPDHGIPPISESWGAVEVDRFWEEAMVNGDYQVVCADVYFEVRSGRDRVYVEVNGQTILPPGMYGQDEWDYELNDDDDMMALYGTMEKSSVPEEEEALRAA